MTLTLDIAPEVEEILRRRAVQAGREEQKLAAELLARTLVQEDADRHETVAAIQEGIADGNTGREEPVEDFVAASKAARSLRRAEIICLMPEHKSSRERLFIGVSLLVVACLVYCRV